jgi:chromatin remodeling complex protein RSC6
MEKPSQNLNEIEQKIKTVEEMLKHLKKDLNKLNEEWHKLNKCKCKCKCKYIKKMQSGFAKPTTISEELCEFLQIEKGSKLSRVEATKKINEYVRKNNLQDKTNPRIINPDEKLAKLLNNKSSQEELTYFNLQKYMRKHFVKI